MQSQITGYIMQDFFQCKWMNVAHVIMFVPNRQIEDMIVQLSCVFIFFLIPFFSQQAFLLGSNQVVGFHYFIVTIEVVANYYFFHFFWDFQELFSLSETMIMMAFLIEDFPASKTKLLVKSAWNGAILYHFKFSCDLY